MKNYFIGLSLLLVGLSAFAADDVEVKVESLSNISQNGAIEACGTAVHKAGVKPLLVTLRHDRSHYSTLTAPNDRWCILFKRWTFSGKVEVSASPLGQAVLSPPVTVALELE